MVLLKPSKTDPSGEESWEVSFRVDDDPDSLSAGAAILNMLKRDDSPLGTNLEAVPLFRDPLTGLEISYEASRRALAERLQEANYGELARGLHSLRIGGATALANDPQGGDFIAGCAGLWTSGCKYRYFHAVRERLESASHSVGRRAGDSLARRPGPLASYQRSRGSGFRVVPVAGGPPRP